MWIFSRERLPSLERQAFLFQKRFGQPKKQGVDQMSDFMQGEGSL
jgi:hypothetical protein